MSALDPSRSKRRPQASKPSRSETAKRACSKPSGRRRRGRSRTSGPTLKMPGTARSRARRGTDRRGRASSTFVAESDDDALNKLGAAEVEQASKDGGSSEEESASRRGARSPCHCAPRDLFFSFLFFFKHRMPPFVQCCAYTTVPSLGPPLQTSVSLHVPFPCAFAAQEHTHHHRFSSKKHQFNAIRTARPRNARRPSLGLPALASQKLRRLRLPRPCLHGTGISRTGLWRLPLPVFPPRVDFSPPHQLSRRYAELSCTLRTWLAQQGFSCRECASWLLRRSRARRWRLTSPYWVILIIHGYPSGTSPTSLIALCFRWH